MFKYMKNKFRNMKRGELTWDTLGKIVLALVLFFILIFILWLLRDKLAEFIENYPRIFVGFGR